jgi:hypothetical protein
VSVYTSAPHMQPRCIDETPRARSLLLSPRPRHPRLLVDHTRAAVKAAASRTRRKDTTVAPSLAVCVECSRGHLLGGARQVTVRQKAERTRIDFHARVLAAGVRVRAKRCSGGGKGAFVGATRRALAVLSADVQPRRRAHVAKLFEDAPPRARLKRIVLAGAGGATEPAPWRRGGSRRARGLCRRRATPRVAFPWRGAEPIQAAGWRPQQPQRASSRAGVGAGRGKLRGGPCLRR